MRALCVHTLADDLSGLALVDRPVPAPGAGEVLVRIEAAALGWPDLLMTRGAYQARPDLPFVPGMEGAGVVVAADPSSGWHAGDRVICGAQTGLCAQYGVFAGDAVMRLPEPLDFAQGAALRVAYLTAWVTLVRLGRAQPGEWVVVHGAAVGVGLATVDLAHALGLRVIAVASDAVKRAAVERLHAPAAVLAGPTGIRDAVRDLTGGRGADVIVDPVGGDVFDEACRYAAFGGRLMVVGFAGGRIATVPANIPLIKGFAVIGVRAGEYGRRLPAHGRAHLAEIHALAEAGTIRPHVHARLPLDAWREGFAAMAERRVIGRSVVCPHS